MIDVQPVVLNIKVIGETTGQEYTGTFKIRPVLTQAEQLTRDSIMRDLLGGRASDATPRAASQAMLLAEIRVRSIETPMFWREASDGLNLYDESVMAAVYDKIQETEKNWRQEIKKKAEEAKAELAKMEPTR